ncbi:MAG: hypothetical protein FWG02_08870 [Holophagaceae bacterium]|nr:hypothetical protein [Holophagaceae bacterium]
MKTNKIAQILTIIVFTPCLAWSPQVHTAQTRIAKGLIPKAMAKYLEQHSQQLFTAAVGKSNSQVPTPEEVEKLFFGIIEMSENGRPAKEIISELGRLANMVQLLTDPSATGGLAFARRVFSEYADEHFSKLVAVKEPLLAAKEDFNPSKAIQTWSRTKYQRYRSLVSHINPDTGAKIGTWDTLSVPFAQMQLGYSEGVNATANLWICAWRMVGNFWLNPEALQKVELP